MKHALTPAEQVGAKKPADDWPRVRAAHLAKHPRCEKSTLGGIACLGAVQVHHVRVKGMGGSRRESPAITLCLAHHGWVHDHPRLAKEAGLMVSRAVSDG